MNMAGGKTITQEEGQLLLDQLPERLLATLSGKALDPRKVVAACDQLVRTLDENDFWETISQLDISKEMGARYLQEAKAMFSRDCLEARLHTELGPDYGSEKATEPVFGTGTVRQRTLPLGVLLHIAAGNMDGLPAFSVLEGLLTGNINILKLPQVDGGLSIKLLLQLVQIEPSLRDYIYVFDYSSKDIESMGKLLDMADGVVVWGGDSAVNALRSAVKPNTKIIEWGHKISFAYVTKQGASQQALEGLAKHICETDQLLCSSCQGVYLDSEHMEDIYDFCSRFLPILEKYTLKIPSKASIGVRGQITLQLYTAELEDMPGRKFFRGQCCSLMAMQSPDLEPSLQFRNVWVKPLPRTALMTHLRHHKNHLQTAGLLCTPEEQTDLTELLWKAGVVRVTSGEAMSSAYCPEPHDGEYPLRRYVRLVSAGYERGRT